MGLSDKTKNWIKNNCEVSLNGKTVVITGANSGVGFKTAETALYLGAKVVMACRSEKKALNAAAELLGEYPGASVTFMKLDLADLSSIDAFVTELREKIVDTYAFVNNAGIFHQPGKTTADGFELVIGTNYVGVYRLSEKLLPYLATLPHEVRYINTISLIHKFAGKIDYSDFWLEKRYRNLSAYSRSKLCLAKYTFELAKRYEDTNVRVLMCHPGIALTPLGLNAYGKWVKRLSELSFLSNMFNSAEKSSLSLAYILSHDVPPGSIIGPDKGLGGWGYPRQNRVTNKVKTGAEELIAFTEEEIKKGNRKKKSMDFFKRFSSATLAAGGTQTVFDSDGDVRTGRVYNKLYVEGTFDFAFLFANVTDSTFSDGSKSKRNMPIGPWRLHGASVAVSDGCEPQGDKTERRALSFGGEGGKDVASGEIFHSDPVTLSVKKGQYVSVELVFSGNQLPCHEESIVPIFRLADGIWKPSVHVPIPAMTGCSREVKKRVCFWGDSITQGIGTPKNSYEHYAAKTAELIGDENIAYWDIALGFARGDDAAARGVWMDKAKTNDIVSVCFGVNDICRGFTAEQIKNSLSVIVSELKKAGCSVLVQTVPPFNYGGAHTEIWREVNRFILGDPSLGADAVFDCVRLLGDPQSPQKAKYGGHPNSEGCLKWAKALAPVLKELIEN